MKLFFYLFILCISFFTSSSTIEAATSELTLPFDTPIMVRDTSTPHAYHFTVEEEGQFTLQADYVGVFYQVNLRERHTQADLDYFSHFSESKTVTYGLKPGDYTIYIVSLEETFSFQFMASFHVGKEPDAHPNATMHDAYTLAPDELVNGHSYHFFPSNDRADFYKVEIPDNKMLVATLQSDDKQLSTLKLLDANGQMLEYASQAARGETLTIDLALSPSTYYLTAQANRYQLVYKLVDRPPFVEIEGNNTLETATPVSLNIPYTADVNDKADYFQFTLPNDQFVQFLVTGKEQKPNFSFELYTSRQELVVQERNKGSVSMHLRAGTYTVKLTDDRINRGFYTFEVKTSAPAENASFEPNNSFSSAQPVPLNHIVYTTGTSKAAHTNFYQIVLTEPGILTLLNSHPTTDDGLYDANGQHLETYGTMAVKKIALKPGTYYIQNSHFDTNRQLTIQFTARSAEQEPNDTQTKATPLPINALTAGYSHIGDVADWYKLDVPVATTYTFKIETIVPFTFGLKQMRIMQADGTMLFENKLGEKQKTMALTKGIYFIQVMGGATSYYSIKWQPAKLTDFKDVPSSYRYYKEISAMRQQDIITGYADNTFKPTAPMQRHHVAAMITRTRLEKVTKELTYRFQFRDVPLSHTNYDAIHLLSDARIVDENSNGFRPAETITRAQMAKILVNTFDLQKKLGKVPQFKDVSAQAWYKEYVDILSSHGITTGANGYFNPNAPVTREHFSLFLYRAFESLK